MVYITSLVTEKMQFNHFPIISLWELSVVMATKKKADHHNLPIFKGPYPSNILTKLGTNRSKALEELSFESVYGWTDKTDYGQKVIIIAQTEHSSGKLITLNER